METAVEPVEVAGYPDDPVVQPVGVAIWLVVIWMVWALAREAGSASVEPVGVDFLCSLEASRLGHSCVSSLSWDSRDGVAASSVGLRLRGMISLKFFLQENKKSLLDNLM